MGVRLVTVGEPLLPRKLLDISRLHQLGWRHAIEVRQGIDDTCEWFVAQPVTAACIRVWRIERMDA